MIQNNLKQSLALNRIRAKRNLRSNHQVHTLKNTMRTMITRMIAMRIMIVGQVVAVVVAAVVAAPKIAIFQVGQTLHMTLNQSKLITQKMRGKTTSSQLKCNISYTIMCVSSTLITSLCQGFQISHLTIIFTFLISLISSNYNLNY